jgi:hypothetical protein
MAEKVYYLTDLKKIQGIAAEMGLKAWKLENLTGAELHKCSPLIKPAEALERIFKYLSSEVIPDGKYLLIGKTGFKSIHRTEIYIQKGNDLPATTAGNFGGGLAYADYSEVMKDNAKLKAENYYYSEQIKVLHEQIAELREELDQDQDQDEETAKNSVYIEMAKEYAPQILNIFSTYLAPKPVSMPASFADAPPAPAPAQKIIRFTPEYNNFWQTCKDQEAVNREYQYLETNRPDKLPEFTKLFGGNG